MKSVFKKLNVHQLKSKPASAFIAYSSFVDICSLLYHKQASECQIGSAKQLK